jgi:hypothetical protein
MNEPLPHGTIYTDLVLQGSGYRQAAQKDTPMMELNS